MTLNVTVLTHDFAACVTDRRLSALRHVHTERARKLIQIDTGPFKGLIAYNGIGRAIEGETPNDWLSEAQLGGKWTLLQFCVRLREISEPRLRALAPQFADNPRHSFVVSGFDSGKPVMGTISNYEDCHGKEEAVAADRLTIDLITPRPKTPFGLLMTGASKIVRRRSVDGLLGALQSDADRKTILGKMTKIIRDTSYLDRLAGSVGSSTLSSVYDPVLGFDMGGGVVGGSKVTDMPDSFLQGVQIRDAWVAGDFEPVSRFDPIVGKYVEHEPSCPKCGTPVPEGQRQCSGCDHVMST
jgi:hypothetical protein